MEAIKLTNVTKEYPGVLAVNNISFSVEKGVIHGFLGPNGAGKTTTMSMICGLTRPTSGKIEITEQIGFLPEHPPLYEQMRVSDFLKFVGKINNLSKETILKNLDFVLDKCGLLHVKDRLIQNLSKGYKQRVGIASVLIHTPKIIILDEPTVGLDPNSIIEIRNLIFDLAKDHTVLLSTHQLAEANALCSHITIINHGEIIESGNVASIKSKYGQTQEIIVELANDAAQKCVDKIKSSLLNSICEIDNNKIIVKINGNEDYRSIISKMIIESGGDLIAMKQTELDLEDLFKMVTRRER